MLRKVPSLSLVLIFTGAALLLTAGAGQAAPRGGGGGFHGGGFHTGGFRGGGFHTGGFRGSGFRSGGFRSGGFGGYYGAWPSYYGSYPYSGYSDYYPYSGYYDYYPYTYSSDWSSPAYDSGYYGSYGGVTSSYPDTYSPPATVQTDTRAQINLSVPADAEVWFEGSRTTSTGSVRGFHSPPLTPGSRYTYDIRARWNKNGHEVTQTQQVEVTAGAHVAVKFPVKPTNARTARSH